jgi:DNA polymerase-3 subunit delta'
MARDAPPRRPIGVSPDGQLPLPWLGDALAQSRALAGAHALLIHGPAGVGHLEFGLLLAQAVLCEAPGAAASGLACGRCASCHLVATRVHPDLLIVLPDALRVQLGWVDDEDSKLTKADAKPSRDVRVEQVRQAIAWSQQTSGRGRGKVLLLHPADAMNGPAANALLKTLEEPPGAMRLLLTSADPERLLPTVRSRCQRLRLALPPQADALAWLQAQGLDDAAALLAAAGGSPLETLAWAQEGLSPALLAALPRRVAVGDASALIGRPLPRVIELLLKLAHDAQVLAAGGAPRFFAAVHLPAHADPAALRQWQHALMRAARHDEHPWNAGLLVESLVSQAAVVWPDAAARPGPKPGPLSGPPAGASLHSAR